MEGSRIATWRDGVLTYLIDDLPGGDGMHFNEALADPAGRVFTGTVPDDLSRAGDCVGTLYRIDTDATITPLLDGIAISNGMGFSPDSKQVYHTDSSSRVINVFDYDAGVWGHLEQADVRADASG